MGDRRIRLAGEADAAAIQAIYRHYVLNTLITFELEPPSEAEMINRMRALAAKYPYLVALDGDTVIGYAYAHEHNERGAYAWNAVLSVYLDNRLVGSGMGGRLFGALLDVLAAQNFHNVYGIVTSPNPRSFAMHERFGFSRVGTFLRSGFKSGKWIDVVWFEKRLRESEGEPAPVVPIGEVSPDVLEAIFARAVEA